MNVKKIAFICAFGMLVLAGIFTGGAAAGVAIQRSNPAWLNRSGGYYYNKSELDAASSKGNSSTQALKQQLAKTQSDLDGAKSELAETSSRLDKVSGWLRITQDANASASDIIEALRVAVEVASNPKYDPGISPDTYLDILRGTPKLTEP
jgi:hypothetical protein